MASKVRFSTEEDEQLIEMVAGRPILWNMADAEFKNAFKKDLIWIKIGRMVNKTDAQCKLRWKSIRDHYKRQKKQERKAGQGSSTTKKRASYWDMLTFLDTEEDERLSFPNTPNESGNIGEIQDPLEESAPNPHSESEDDRIDPDLYAASTVQSTEYHGKRKYDYPTGSSVSQMSDSRIMKFKKDNFLVDLLQEIKEDRLQNRKYLEKILETEAEDEIFLFFKAMASTVQKFDPEAKTEAKMKIFNIVTEMEMRQHKSRTSANEFSTLIKNEL